MTLRTRLALALVVIGLVLVIPLVMGMRSLGGLKRTISEMQTREFAASTLLGRMRAGLDSVRNAELALYVNKDSASLPRFEREVDRVRATNDSLSRFAFDTAAMHIDSTLRGLRALGAVELRMLTTDRADSALMMSESLRRRITYAERWVGRGEREVGNRIGVRVDATVEQSEQAQSAAVAAFGLAALIATLIGVWLVRSISRPVRDLERGMHAVAGGDFGHRLQLLASRRDEFARLAASYHTMSARLAELDKLKAEFVSVASHELKTPINVIGGYLQLLEEGVYGPLTPKQLEVCGTIAAQCDSLARLVRQLLDVSRFEAGGGKIEPRRLVLRTFLDDLERAFHVLALQRSVQFRVIRVVGLPQEVTWDADRVNEVLGNMLSNAFKFTPRSGTVDLVAEPEDNAVRLTVRDTGAGIPPAQLPHIFKKFFQADNQASASAKGTGLGLAISKGIVDAHGGSIAVDSALGVGTTFTIVLPEHVRSSRRATPRSTRVVAGAGR